MIQKPRVVFTRPVICWALRRIQLMLKCSAQSPATETPWLSSQATTASYIT
jgi:hypothetical protein